MTSSLRMLQGIKVVELGQGVAAPYCAQLLSDAGAEVIKLEMAPGGDRMREVGARSSDPKYRDSGITSFFVGFNRNKKSIALDLRDERGREIGGALIAQADVFIENNTPGVVQKLGWDYQTLSRKNPRLIMVSSSAAGQHGPLADIKGYDWIGQAYAGITNGIGYPGQAPCISVNAFGDVATAIASAMAIGFAIIHRDRTGEGQYIDASLLATYFQMNDSNVAAAGMVGEKAVFQRNGSIHLSGPVTGVYRCGEGYVVIVIAPHLWPAFVRTMGRPDLEHDPRFAAFEARRGNKELQAIIEAWFATFASRDDGVRVMQDAGLPCAPVLTTTEAVHHPHHNENKIVRWTEDRALGRVSLPGDLVRSSAWPGPERIFIPALGEHNGELLRGLGYSDEKIAALQEDGVLVDGGVSSEGS